MYACIMYACILYACIIYVCIHLVSGSKCIENISKATFIDWVDLMIGLTENEKEELLKMALTEKTDEIMGVGALYY